MITTHTTCGFRAALERDNHLPLGTWIKLPALESVELVAGAGFDFVVIDLEHSPLDIGTVYALIGIAKTSGLSPIVRIPATDTGLIQRVLDSGADGLMFPHIDSADEARSAVRAMRFPPQGTRGVGNTSRAGHWGALDRDEYLRFGNEEVLCIAQIESAAAALVAGDIAAVDGVDAVLIGAADLAVSEGQAETDAPIVELIAKAIAAVQAAGVPVGNAGAATEEAVRATVDAGYDFTMLSNDATLLGSAARQAVSVGRRVCGRTDGSPQTWHPTRERTENANVEVFRRWLKTNRGLHFDDYTALQRWSATDITQFWGALWAYFDIAADSPYDQVLVDETMPGAQWFPGATLNYVDQIFRHRHPDAVAVIDESEPGGAGRRTLSWAELERQVGAVADTLRRSGVGHGDRVVGYLPNIAEAVVAFLATASLGAIWASCGQDYSAPAAVDRLGQLEPKALIAADGYHYGGKAHDRREAIDYIRSHIPSLDATIVIPRIGLDATGLAPITTWAKAAAGDTALETTPVAFDHPLWVLFSSGTSGRPKGIVHGHGGVVLEHLKSMSFHLDISPGNTYFWYTSPSWMMWNFQVAGLLVGATIVCYDGSPGFPTTDTLWALADRNRVTHLGTSPAYLQACEKGQHAPAAEHDLSTLETLGVTGSVLPPASYHWVAKHVGSDVQVASMTGGTDVVSAFATAVPTVPVQAGEIPVVSLGAALEAWDEDGNALIGDVGEMVLTKPMPSMPVHFWNDPDGKRYRDAYFDTYPGVWRHGDWITISDHGSVVVHGRSDSTLNRNGVRMGSSDIYQAAEKLPEVRESLVIGVEYPDGTYWMPLFVTLADDTVLDDDLTRTICDTIRRDASPRHVPDEILAAPAIPHTRTGKKLEIPIKRLFQGAPVDAVIDPQAVDDAAALQWYIDLAAQRNRTSEDTH